MKIDNIFIEQYRSCVDPYIKPENPFNITLGETYIIIDHPDLAANHHKFIGLQFVPERRELQSEGDFIYFGNVINTSSYIVYTSIPMLEKFLTPTQKVEAEPIKLIKRLIHFKRL